MQTDALVFRDRKPIEVVQAIPSPEGPIREWFTVKFPLGLGGVNRYLGGVAIDITEQRRALETIRRSEELYRTVFETAGSALAIIEEDTTISMVNSVFEKLSGYSKLEVDTKRSWANFVAPEDRERLRDYHIRRRLDPASVPKHYEFTFIDNTGDRRDVLASIELLPDGKRSIASMLDFTERNRADKRERNRNHVMELLSSGASLEGVLTAIAEVVEQEETGAICSILFTDQEGKRLLHGAAPSLPNFYHQAVNGIPIGDGVGSCGTAAFIKRRVVVEDVMTHPYWIAFKDLAREAGLASCWSEPIFGTGGRLLGTFAIYHRGPKAPTAPEIELIESTAAFAGAAIERKQIEGQIRQQAALLDISADAIYVKDLDSKICFWNQSCSRLYGWSADEAMGKTTSELIHHTGSPEYEAAEIRVLNEGSWIGELTKKTREGKEVVVQSRWTLVRDSAGNPQSVFVAETDVTEKKRLEEQFFRAQRMESIGTLAGGIAHDLNNALGPIMLVTQILQRKQLDESVARLLDTISSSAQRGADLVKQILAFARGVKGEHALLQPKHILGELINIARQTFPKSIQIQSSLPKDLGLLKGDATKIHQVFLNLLVNSRDAMPKGGSLTMWGGKPCRR